MVRYRVTGILNSEQISGILDLVPVDEPGPSPSNSFAPPDGQCYWGFGYQDDDWSDPRGGDTRPLAERYGEVLEVECGQKKPTLVHRIQYWRQPNGSMVQLGHELDVLRRYDNIAGHEHTLFLKWEVGGPGSVSTQPYTGLTTKDIVSGSLDSYVRAFAAEVKAYGQPVFLAPVGGEFNGNYTWNTGPHTNPALTYEDFRGAWRRVVDIFRTEGATNAAYVWAPAVSPPDSIDWGQDKRWREFWPGDDYVDWCGGVLFAAGEPAWMDPFYQFAVQHAKPFCLEGWGVRHTGTKTTTENVLWLQGMFDYIEGHPAIKMISYFNRNGCPWDAPGERRFLIPGVLSYHPDVNDSDSRLLTDDRVGEIGRFRQMFRNRIAHPRYVSSIVT